eukprot:CAMPEP_0197851410 /NCGR_PEP_ID=MMETSP1438-20131217/18007_1 /TAXON_ID=1461541 /ORGANISM="Pterosperma sp., Strain CCMP1384" /LENGTH=44 /DNA_ID= /DNA_START= /DNA_END= /DNA_ORIENTATION=
MAVAVAVAVTLALAVAMLIGGWHTLEAEEGRLHDEQGMEVLDEW